MISVEQKKNCCGCNACGDICPKNAISFNTDTEGFWYPSVDQSKCVNCGLCDKVCPMLNEYRTSGAIEKPECYAAEHKSVDVVFSSTTGGMFSAMADVMYKRKGYVGGAIHNKDFSVSEFISNDKKDLELLRRSKDLQSDATGFYIAVKNLLNAGESVLVCALPCQIAALKTYLGKEYANLITIDLICLGVNSPKVWRKYLDYIEELNNSKIVWTENKSKEYGWHNLTQKFVFENGKEYFDTSNTSLFIKGFIKSHLYCRPSCYACQFKKFPRPADITIGDFWGIERHDPSFNSNMGTSVVIVNTQKGKTFFEDVKKRIRFKESPLEWALSGNPALTRSITDISDKRDEFFNELECSPFDVAIAKYGDLDKKTSKEKKAEIRSYLSFIKRIITVTRLHPKPLYYTIKYSGLKNLLKKKGILCGLYSVLNIDKKANLDFEGLLTLGCKGHFPNSKLESRLCVGKNATLKVMGDFEVEYDCDIEVFDRAELIIQGKKYVKSDANEGLTIVCGERIELGADVGIGRNVHIRDTNGNHYLNTTGYRTTRPVVIGEKAWLCESCTIMPGVKIGVGSVVGVNSTVTKSVPDHALVSGYPATVVQENVIWKR